VEEEKLVQKIKELANKGDIVIVKETNRDSEVYYNYKTWRLFIIYRPIAVRYEDVRIRDIKVIEISTGAYQEYDETRVEVEINRLKKEGYTVHVIHVF